MVVQIGPLKQQMQEE